MSKFPCSKIFYINVGSVRLIILYWRLVMTATALSFQNGSFLNGSASASAGTLTGTVNMSNIYNEDYLDEKYNYQDSKESYELAYGGRDASIETSIENISTYLQDGREDKALEAYNELLSEMSSQKRYAQLVTEDGSDKQLRAVAKQLIESEIGCDLKDYINDNARSNAGVEKQKLLSWGNCDSTSREDLLSEMCDIDEEKSNGSIIMKGVCIIASPFVALGNFLFRGGKKM